MLRGREEETAHIDALLEAARGGSSSALVIVGDPGTGKSELCRYAMAHAGDAQVLATRGVESEAELPFAALSELLAPIVSCLDRIPEPQAAALRAALALGPPVGGDRLAVAAGTLSLLAAAAEEAPVLAVIDDAHWVDAASGEALRFAAKRLQSDGVAVLFARRPGVGTFDDGGLDGLVISGLDHDAALALLLQQAPDIDRGVAERVVGGTAGNPLALVELPSILTAAQLAGAESLEDPLPVGAALGDAFRRLTENLPSDTQKFLLLAAAAGGDTPLEALRAAAEVSGFGLDALAAAEAQGLVSVGRTGLEFRHPLFRSSIYHAAPAVARRAVHRSLAAAMVADDGSGRRAWHLAAAAVGADADAAEALEGAGDNAFARNALPSAAMAYERSAELTADADERARRLISGARAYTVFGRANDACRLARQASAIARDGALRAAASHLDGLGSMFTDPPRVAHALLVAAAEDLAERDPLTAAAVLADASMPCFMEGDVTAAAATAKRAAELASGENGLVERLASFLYGGALGLLGDRSGIPAITAAARFLLEMPGSLLEVHPVMVPQSAHGLIWSEQHDLARSILERYIGEARRAAALGVLPLPLTNLADLEFRVGRWSTARAAAAECVEISDALGQPHLALNATTLLTMVDARQARPECEPRARMVIEMGTAASVGSLVTYAHASLGHLALATGDLDRAVEELERARHLLLEVCKVRNPSVVLWQPDLIEAHVRRDQTDDARAALAVLEEHAARSGSRFGAFTARRCRGLLADDAEIDRVFADALRLHAALEMPFERARTELAYGERLRRAGRRRDARQHLKKAVATFGALDAVPWLERARSELTATGESVAPREAHSSDLTAQEQQVALSVAAGRSNKEVAALLFISPKTVEYHLGNVYRKLGVRSRIQLARALGAFEQAMAQRFSAET